METTRRTLEEKIRIVEELKEWRVQGGTTVRFAEENGITRKSLNEWKRKLPACDADRTVTLVGEPGPTMTAGPEESEGAPVLISVGGVTVAVFGGTPIACISRVLALLGMSHVL